MNGCLGKQMYTLEFEEGCHKISLRFLGFATFNLHAFLSLWVLQYNTIFGNKQIVFGFHKYWYRRLKLV